MDATIVIIGAGPAGIAAAATLVRAGVRPILIDEALQPGGQIYRQPQSPLRRPIEKLYGFDAGRAQAFLKTFAEIRPLIDYRPETQVWAAGDQLLHLLDGNGCGEQAWTHLIVAPGAMDRIAPVKGWTATGVYSLGGAQIALKAEASLVGRRVILAGSGPLLYLVAYQYAKAGAEIAAVLETGRPFAQLANFPGLAAGGSVFAKGLFYIAALRLRGIPLLTNVALREVLRNSDDHVTGVAFRHRGVDKVETCDGLAIGHGLRSQTQLADLLNVEFAFDQLQRQWLPRADTDGRTSTERVYLAGDGVSIRGSEIAEASGRLAATAVLQDIGRPVPSRIMSDRAKVKKAVRFRAALERTFAYPYEDIAALSDEVVVCRCEHVTAGTIRKTVAVSGESDINRIKAFCRVGMGRCQGRLCAPGAAELIAAASGNSIDAVGRMRGQAPIKPVPLADLKRSRS
jgi:NADPH-dependent 2,4-dienoyl-CoA reductase/sulfur reductase-like enzyme